MFLTILLLAADTQPATKAAKASFCTLSQQSLLEMLIAEIADQTPFYRSKKLPWSKRSLKDECTWPGVACDEEQKVTTINWKGKGLAGVLNVRYLPQTIEKFSVENNALRGFIPLGELPHSIEELHMQNNEYAGSVALPALPPNIRIVDLSFNALSGEIDITQLPDSLTKLNLSHNKLTGGVDLHFLPKGICVINLAENQLSGDADLRNISRVDVLDLWSNRFRALYMGTKFTRHQQGHIYMLENPIEKIFITRKFEFAKSCVRVELNTRIVTLEDEQEYAQ